MSDRGRKPGPAVGTPRYGADDRQIFGGPHVEHSTLLITGYRYAGPEGSNHAGGAAGVLLGTVPMSGPESRAGTRFGKYELTALLGRGGMGEVYEAFDTEKRRAVALKILRAEYARDDRFRTRFLRESHAAAILQEPHVIPIHDWGEIDGNLFIDMRLVQGRTLHDLITDGPLGPDRAVEIVQQVADALDAAHAEGLVHRDVKPHNILVTPADFAYLVDFGIAAMQGDSRLTLAGTQIGSLAYMAPERFNDEPCTPATDIYALACVLYEALTGNTPFDTGSHESLIAAHLSTPPPAAGAANPRVPAALDAVIARGMAKQPDDRYGSAGALARAARRALTSAGGVDPAAATMAAPVAAGPVAAGPVAAGPVVSGPQDTGPTVALSAQSGAARTWMVPVALVGIALLLGATGVVIGLLMSPGPETPAPVAVTPELPTVLAPTTIIQTAPVTTSTKTVTATAPPPPPTRPAASVSVQPGPEAASLQRLRRLAAGDRAFVADRLADRWVPQLSSKRPGIVDKGVTWDNALTLQEHLLLRQRYDAVLVWSGDWSTFDAPNYWVTIVPVTFATPDGALAWCRAQGLGRNDCYAKLVSTTHPVRGSTAHN